MLFSKKMFQFVVFLLVIGMASGSALAMNVVMLNIDPPAQNYFIGDIITADLKISGLQNEDLGLFNLNLSYDDSILSYDSYTLGTGLGNGVMDISLADNFLTAGIINLAGYVADTSPQDDEVILATLNFIGTGAGISELSIVDSIMYSDSGSPLSLYASPNPGFVNVNHAPVPAAAWLLGSGLLGLVGIRSRCRG